tara:strand:- start:1363 stop:1653 length:291 start_codon:yes stop_codon:yes gene_type:complete
MEILFGIFIFLTFMALIVFGVNYLFVRIELEKKGIKLSYFIWIIPDLIKLKDLIIVEKNENKKAEYQRIYNWCVKPFGILIFCGIISIILFSYLSE